MLLSSVLVQGRAGDGRSHWTVLMGEGKFPQLASPPWMGNGLSLGHKNNSQLPRWANIYSRKFQNRHHTDFVFLKAILWYKVLPILSMQFNDLSKLIASWNSYQNLILKHFRHHLKISHIHPQSVPVPTPCPRQPLMCFLSFQIFT